MNLILPLLKSKLAALGAVLVVAVIIILWGPRIVGYRNRWWCYGIAALLVIGFLLYLLIKKLRARKNARMLEKFLNQQADDQLLSSRPDVQDELAAIKEKLTRAIGILKKSRMARGRRGAEALYVLPWYMIIGPSASGKSTAIRNSGLHFPPVDPDSEDPGKVKGLGGTRNCDWWFTNEGIVLDTAGRYTLSPNVQEDREEWSNFLKMLQKARPRAPINGLILAVSADELLHQDADGIEAHARAMRSRIDELIVKLQVLFPIYVVFTKCDLIAGFVEFFGDFTKGEREQVWGFTRKYEPSRRPIREEFEQEFSQLAGVLERRRSRQLAGEMRPAQKRGTYLFSVEFAAAGQKLAAFVEALFQPNPYQQNPLVRGFYFTSGTQEGTPIAQVMEAMQRDFGLVSDFMAQFEPVKETKAYFIKDLFQEVILPDEAKVYPTSKSARRRRTLRLVALIGQVVLAGLLALALGTSYVNNCNHNASLARAVKQVADVTAGKYTPSVGLLMSLDELRERLEQAESGVPLSLRWGLYSGAAVVRAGKEIYFRRYHDILLEPTARGLGGKLREPLGQAAESEVDAYNGKFTAYRMLTMPYGLVPKSGGTLREEVVSFWSPLVHPDSVSLFTQLAEAQVGYYWKHRPDTTILPLRAQFDQSVYNYAKEQLRSRWNLPLVYRDLISDINGELGEYSYADAAPGTVLLNGGSIGRAFTREGWEKKIAPRIEGMPEEIAADPEKKIAFSEYSPDDIRRQLTDMYVTDFIARWRTFIASGSILPFRNLDDAKEALAELSQDGSAILSVLNKVYDQCNLKDLDDKPAARIEEQFRPLARFLGHKLAQGDQPGKKTYLELFGTTPDKVAAVKDKLEGGARCADALRAFATDLDAPESKTRLLLRGTDLAKAAADLLVKPLRAAKDAAFGGACSCLDRQWQAQVLEVYNTSLATQYPFSRTSDADAPTPNVQSFFGTFAGFVKNEIEPAQQLGLPVSGAFQSAKAIAGPIQQILARGATQLRFSLTASAEGMTSLSSIRLEYSTDPAFEYMMGSPQTREYRWPQSQRGDARLAITSNQDGLYFQPLSGNGEWGIFRLIDQAEKAGNVLTWNFQTPDGRRQKAILRLGGSDASFILSGHFTRFQCPQSVCH
jgi:type VI secretion system protein ImpL